MNKSSPPAMRLTVSRTWSALICRVTMGRSNWPGCSVLLPRTQRTKCGLACTSVRKRLSNRVWKSWVSVETGSSPFNLKINDSFMNRNGSTLLAFLNILWWLASAFYNRSQDFIFRVVSFLNVNFDALTASGINNTTEWKEALQIWVRSWRDAEADATRSSFLRE